MNFRGELAALAAAFLWAIASVLYDRLGRKLSPLILNLVKGAIAIVLLVLTLLFRSESFPAVSVVSVGLLLLSGAIGIGFGDTCFFAGLNQLGARRVLLMEALAPPLAALLALIFLQETLSLANCAGVALTIAGVAWVVGEQVHDTPQKRGHFWQGIGFSLLAVLGQAVGAVLSRAALTQSDISPLWSTVLRLGAGLVVLLLWYLTQRGSTRSQQPASSISWTASLMATVALAAFIGTYLGIWLQQTSLKYTAAGIAQSLSATSPLFILPIAARLGEPVSLRAIIGVVVAIAGIALLFGWQ